jgi:hypothetical protein
MSQAPYPLSRSAKHKAQYRDQQRRNKQVMQDIICKGDALPCIAGSEQVPQRSHDGFGADVWKLVETKDQPPPMLSKAPEVKQTTPEEHYIRYGSGIGYQKLKRASGCNGMIWSSFSRYPVTKEEFYQVVERLNLLLVRIHASGVRERIAFMRYLGDNAPLPQHTQDGDKVDAESLHQTWKARWEEYHREYVDPRTGWNKTDKDRFYKAVQSHLAKSRKDPDAHYQQMCLASLAKPVFDNSTLKRERIHRAVLCEEALDVYNVLSGMCCLSINKKDTTRHSLYSCDLIGISSVLNLPFEYKLLVQPPQHILDIPYDKFAKLTSSTDKPNYYRYLLKLFPVYGQQASMVAISARSINCIRGSDQLVSYGNVVANTVHP